MMIVIDQDLIYILKLLEDSCEIPEIGIGDDDIWPILTLFSVGRSVFGNTSKIPKMPTVTYNRTSCNKPLSCDFLLKDPDCSPNLPSIYISKPAGKSLGGKIPCTFLGKMLSGARRQNFDTKFWPHGSHSSAAAAPLSHLLFLSWSLPQIWCWWTPACT